MYANLRVHILEYRNFNIPYQGLTFNPQPPSHLKEKFGEYKTTGLPYDVHLQQNYHGNEPALEASIAKGTVKTYFKHGLKWAMSMQDALVHTFTKFIIHEILSASETLELSCGAHVIKLCLLQPLQTFLYITFSKTLDFTIYKTVFSERLAPDHEHAGVSSAQEGVGGGNKRCWHKASSGRH